MTPTKRSSKLLELLEDLENTDDDGLKTKKKTAGDELGVPPILLGSKDRINKIIQLRDGSGYQNG